MLIDTAIFYWQTQEDIKIGTGVYSNTGGKLLVLNTEIQLRNINKSQQFTQDTLIIILCNRIMINDQQKIIGMDFKIMQVSNHDSALFHFVLFKVLYFYAHGEFISTFLFLVGLGDCLQLLCLKLGLRQLCIGIYLQIFFFGS